MSSLCRACPHGGMQSLACSRHCPAGPGQLKRPLVACAVHAAQGPSSSEQPARTRSSHPAHADAEFTGLQPVTQPLSGDSVGVQLLQQRPQQPQLSLGMMMMQMPYLPLPKQPQPQRQHQPQQPPQRPQRRQLSTSAGRPSPPAALTAADGYLVSQTGRYSAPEALQLQGLVWSQPSLDELEQAVLRMPPEAVAAAAHRAAAEAADVVGPGLLAGDKEHQGYSYSGSRPQLFLALQAVVADRQAQIHQQLPAGEHSICSNSNSSIGSAGNTGSSRLRHLRRRRTSSSSSTPVSNSAAVRPASDADTSSKGGADSSKSNNGSRASRSTMTCSRQNSSEPSFQQQQTEQQQQHYHHQSPAVAPESEADVLQRLHEGLAQRGLALSHVLGFGQHRLVCPVCEGGRTSERSLALTLQDPSKGDGAACAAALWICHRATCGVQGGFRLPCLPRRARSSTSSSSTGGIEAASGGQEPAVQFAAKPLPAQCGAQLQPLSPELLAWLVGERCISRSVLSRNRVAGVAGSQQGPSVAFPYYSRGVLVNIKFRSLTKSFWQLKGGQQVFYGVDDLQGADEAIIVEGELDKLAVETVLPHSAHGSSAATAILSLPAGALPAPKASHRPSPASKKLACVDRAASQLQKLRRIIIAVDGDGPGQGTAEALMHKLRLVHQQQHGSQQGAPQQLLYLPWPTAAGGEGVLRRAAQQAAAQGLHVDLAAAVCCKDANDVLRACGPEFLRLYISYAQLV